MMLVVKLVYFLVNHFSARARSEGLMMSFAFTTVADLSMTCLISSGIFAVTSILISDSFADFVTMTDFDAGRLCGAAVFFATAFFAGAFFAAVFFFAAAFLVGFSFVITGDFSLIFCVDCVHLGSFF